MRLSGVIGLLREDLLERNLAMELAVQRHAYQADAAPGVRPERVESTTVGSRLPDPEDQSVVASASEIKRGRGVDRVVDGRTAVDERRDLGQRGLDLGIPQSPQTSHECRRRGDRGQTRSMSPLCFSR